MLPVAEYNGERLRYPIGVGDLSEVSGQEFDLEAYRKVPQFFFLGAADTNDAVADSRAGLY